MYKDINPTLAVHPDTHDFSVTTQTAAINGSIRNLVLTNKYERPYNTILYSNVRKLLFDQVSAQVADVLQTTITQLINNFEPRAIDCAVTVTVNSQGNGYLGVVQYTIPVNGKRTSLTIGLNK